MVQSSSGIGCHRYAFRTPKEIRHRQLRGERSMGHYLRERLSDGNEAEGTYLLIIWDLNLSQHLTFISSNTVYPRISRV